MRHNVGHVYAVLIWNSECRGELSQSNLFYRKRIRGRNYFYWNLKRKTLTVFNGLE